MTYTVADLDAAVEGGKWVEHFDPDDHYDAETPEWMDFFEALTKKRVLRWFDEEVEGSEQERYGPRKGQWFRFEDREPGADIPNIGHAEFVEDFGGEGQGDSYWFVFKVTDADGNVRFFRRNGWYASYDGGYYDGPTDEVEEAIETIKVYKKV